MNKWVRIALIIGLGALITFLVLNMKEVKNVEFFHKENKQKAGGFVAAEILRILKDKDKRLEEAPLLFDEFIQEFNPREDGLFVLGGNMSFPDSSHQIFMNIIKEGGIIVISSTELYLFFQFLTDSISIEKNGVSYYRENEFLSAYQEERLNCYTDCRYVLRDSLGEIFALREDIGLGRLIIHSAPYQLLNQQLIKNVNRHQYYRFLEWLDMREYYWANHVTYASASESFNYNGESNKRPEPFLDNPFLRIVAYLVMMFVVLFLFFGGKRELKAIPLLKAEKNTTQEFVNTLSNVFLLSKDHRTMGRKKWAHLRTYTRERFQFDWTEEGRQNLDVLAKKSNVDRKELKEIQQLYRMIEDSPEDEASLLLKLNDRIENFYTKTGKYA